MTAASSNSSERDERVFIAAFGIMDSHQDGEAIAAFMRVRAILHRHGSGFRRMLERSHEAELLNEQLGLQNAQLLRENTALRARDSRPASPSPVNAKDSFRTRAMPEFRHWDIGLVGVIAILAKYGLLGFTASFTLTAAVLISAAFANWFSPMRFFAGVVFGLMALGIVVFNQSASADAPALAVADPLATVTPATTGRAFANAMPPGPTFVDAAQPGQTFADALSPRPTFAVTPPRQTFVEPRPRRGWGSHCGPYRLQPGFTCPRSTLWRRNFFPDYVRPRNMRYG
ncbi:MAG TPA: hypothetical protein VLJ17_00290 [Xanthobacteraceae bacterium]|nr:hypothetical protein [Xanthobacteraceae bacterium]